MKRIALFILPALIAFSCHDDAKPDRCGIELKLVDMVVVWYDGTQTGDEDLPYQETIFLSKDNTFVKTRTQNRAVTQATGTYVRANSDDRTYIQLTYSDPSTALRVSCDSEEWIQIASSTEYKNTSWMPCDGPMLVYAATTLDCGN